MNSRAPAQARFGWVFRLLEQYPEERDFDAAWAFPDAAPKAQLAQLRGVREWLAKSPLGRRPLVKVRGSKRWLKDP